MAENPSSNQILAMTTEIVVSHVANNAVAAGDLHDLIQQVYATLATVPGEAAGSARPKPAVTVKKSLEELSTIDP